VVEMGAIMAAKEVLKDRPWREKEMQLRAPKAKKKKTRINSAPAGANLTSNEMMREIKADHESKEAKKRLVEEKKAEEKEIKAELRKRKSAKRKAEGRTAKSKPTKAAKKKTKGKPVKPGKRKATAAKTKLPSRGKRAESSDDSESESERGDSDSDQRGKGKGRAQGQAKGKRKVRGSVAEKPAKRQQTRE